MSWTQSEKVIYDLALANVKKTNKAIARVYLKTQREISEQLKAFYLIVSPSDSKAFQAARLTAIFKDINRRLSISTKLSTKMIEESYLEQYQSSFYLYAYGLSAYYSIEAIKAGVTAKWTALPFKIKPKKTIMASLTEKVGDYSFNNSQILGQQQLSESIKEAYRETLREEVAKSIKLGESPIKLAKRLKSSFDTVIAQHIRTARTEMLKAYSLAQEESIAQAEEMGIEFTFMWLGRADNRERASHIALNNTYAKIDKRGNPYFEGGGCKGSGPRLMKGGTSRQQKAMNINCRCRKLAIPMEIDTTKEFPTKTVDASTKKRPNVSVVVPDFDEYLKTIS